MYMILHSCHSDTEGTSMCTSVHLKRVHSLIARTFMALLLNVVECWLWLNVNIHDVAMGANQPETADEGQSA